MVFVSKLRLVKVSCNMGANNTITTASSSGSGAPWRPTSFFKLEILVYVAVVIVCGGSTYAVVVAVHGHFVAEKIHLEEHFPLYPSLLHIDSALPYVLVLGYDFCHFHGLESQKTSPTILQCGICRNAYIHHAFCQRVFIQSHPTSLVINSSQ